MLSAAADEDALGAARGLSTLAPSAFSSAVGDGARPAPGRRRERATSSKAHLDGARARLRLGHVSRPPKSRPGLKMEPGRRSEERTLKAALKRLTAADCARCLRSPTACSGSKSSSPPPCAGEQGGNFAPAIFAQAFKLALAYLALQTAEGCFGAASCLYANGGVSFGSDAGAMAANVERGVNAYSSYAAASPEPPLPSMSFSADPEHLLRALVAMPDLGSPSIAAGECWWRGYGATLRSLGLLRLIRKASCDEEMGFGDGPQSAPLFALLQVPLWHRAESGPPLLVFVNIKIIKNVVGLLDGKANLQALHMTSHLRPGRGCSAFYILGAKLVVDDAGSHFFVRLRPPTPIAPEQTGMSLQKGDCEVLRSVEVNAIAHMKTCRARPHAFDPTIFVLPPDGFPELSLPPFPQAHSSVRSRSHSAQLLSGRFALLSEDPSSVVPAADDKAETPSKIVLSDTSPVLSHALRDDDSNDDRDVLSDVPALSHALRDDDSDDYSDVNDDSFDLLLEHPFATQPLTSHHRRPPALVELASAAALHYADSTAAFFSRIVAYYTRLPTEDAAIIAAIPKLHEVLGHPSASQLLLLLAERLPHDGTLSASVRQAVKAFVCHFCDRRARRHEPPRPRVSVPPVRAPGLNLHIDIGKATSPTHGRFDYMVMTDQFSLFVMGDSLDAPPSAETVLPVYLHKTIDAYPDVTFDLQSAFTSQPFIDVLARLGTAARAVMTNAHWPSSAEKSVDLLRVELDAVFEDFSSLSPSLAVQVAMQRLNYGIMPGYQQSRAALHLGREPQLLRCRDELLAQAPPPWLPASLSDCEDFLNAADSKRTDHVRRVARRRLATALRQRLSSATPLELFNGDQYLIWRTGVSPAASGYIGPFMCLGHHRSVVIGYGPGRAVAAHISRCLLYKRSPTRAPCTPLDDPFLGRCAAREPALLTPVTLDDLGAFASGRGAVDGADVLDAVDGADVVNDVDAVMAADVVDGVDAVMAPDVDGNGGPRGVDGFGTALPDTQLPADALDTPPPDNMWSTALPAARFPGADGDMDGVDAVMAADVDGDNGPRGVAGFDTTLPDTDTPLPADALETDGVDAVMAADVDEDNGPRGVAGFDTALPDTDTPLPAGALDTDGVDAVMAADVDGDNGPRGVVGFDTALPDTDTPPPDNTWSPALPAVHPANTDGGFDTALPGTPLPADALDTPPPDNTWSSALPADTDSPNADSDLPVLPELLAEEVLTAVPDDTDIDLPAADTIPNLPVLPALPPTSAPTEDEPITAPGATLPDTDTDLDTTDATDAPPVVQEDEPLPVPAPASLRMRLRSAMKRARSPSPPPTLPPKHLRTKYMASFAPRTDPSVWYYVPSKEGTFLQRMYLVDKAKKRTRVLEYDEAVEIPE